MNKLSVFDGSCACGNVAISINLPNSVKISEARRCDCDFCRSYAAAYVSHPEGEAAFTIRDTLKTEKLRQGTATAWFLVCSQCGNLICAIYEDKNQVYASVNAACMPKLKNLEERVVSPQLLDKEQKTTRWRKGFFRGKFTS